MLCFKLFVKLNSSHFNPQILKISLLLIKTLVLILMPSHLVESTPQCDFKQTLIFLNSHVCCKSQKIWKKYIAGIFYNSAVGTDCGIFHLWPFGRINSPMQFQANSVISANFALNSRFLIENSLQGQSKRGGG